MRGKKSSGFGTSFEEEVQQRINDRRRQTEKRQASVRRAARGLAGCGRINAD